MKNAEMILRFACEEDVEALFAVEKDCFDEPWPHHEILKEIHRRESRVEVVSVPEIGIIAYSCSWKVDDEMQLLRIGTRPSFRKSGAARALLGSLLQDAERTRYRLIHLEVGEQNHGALHLYQQVGFVRIGMRTNYYRSPPDHAVLMVRYIGDVNKHEW